MRQGQTPPKSELRQAKNGAFATLAHGAETAPSKPLNETIKDRRRWEENVAQPSLDKETQMKLVGNGCEKAKHHLNPSSGKPKTVRSQPFHTVPKLHLRNREKRDK